ncbi:hypothetical protein CLOSTASPAR_06804, partial [[Clostridium] asparagiforme DSM 15981]
MYTIVLPPRLLISISYYHIVNNIIPQNPAFVNLPLETCAIV